MADWPGWVGMLTGVTGLALAIISYRRAGKLKKLDLYVDSGRMANELRQAYEQLTELHGGSLKARQNMAAALGLFTSGAMQKWEGEWNPDKAIIDELTIPDANADYHARSPTELSKTIVTFDRSLQTVNALNTKYREWAEWNEKKGDEIRKAHRRPSGQ